MRKTFLLNIIEDKGQRRILIESTGHSCYRTNRVTCRYCSVPFPSPVPAEIGTNSSYKANWIATVGEIARESIVLDFNSNFKELILILFSELGIQDRLALHTIGYILSKNGSYTGENHY